MRCPKCKTENFYDGLLADDLIGKVCTGCEGVWIEASQYETWLEVQPQSSEALDYLSPDFNVHFQLSPYDSKAALCPQCNRYLSRAKVNIKTPFFIERCGNCGGIWCDTGEWQALQYLGLDVAIPQLFSGEWQSRVQQKQHAYKEREATIEKLGTELAAMVFELGEMLANHPHGDFAIAYLVRKVSGE